MTEIRVSALVVTYYTGLRLKECLYALLADPEVQEIVVVDNGNPAPVQSWLRPFSEAHASVVLLSEHGNIGFGAAVNLGAKAARGSEFLVINPDAVLRRGSVSKMLRAAEDKPDPAIVGGKVFDLSGQETRGARRRELTLWRAVTSLFGWNTWTLEKSPAPARAVEMAAISGAFFLISRQSFEHLNGFDERYFLHVEDVDLCKRCWEAGGTVIYTPFAAALHYGSTSEAPRDVVKNHKAESLSLYFRTHSKGTLEKTLVAIAMPIMRLAMRPLRR